MNEANYQWKDICTHFEGNAAEVTFMYRNDQKSWNLHWRILGKWKNNKKLLKKRINQVEKWAGRISLILTILLIISAISSLSLTSTIADITLGSVALVNAFIHFIFTRTHFAHHVTLNDSAKLSEKWEINKIKGGQNG